MKKTLIALVVLAAFVAQTADARGGRGFSVGRSFSRPASAKISKSPQIKRAAPTKLETPPKDEVVKPTATPSAQTTSRPGRNDDDDSSGGGFWSSFFGGAVGAAAGSAAYDAMTSDEVKSESTKEEAQP